MVRALYQRILGRLLHSESQAEPDPFFTSQDGRYTAYQIGEWTYGKPKVVSWDEGTSLRIGKFCSIAEGVTIVLGGEHRTDWVTTYPFNAIIENAKKFEGHPRTKGDVTIGNDVWIGMDVIILSGVTIGDGAVIGARSVVTKDVSPYSIVAGNPGRQVRFRFSEAIINSLQSIRWWDWPISEIQAAWPVLLSPEIEAFIAKYEESRRPISSASGEIKSHA
jgi:acetyltransferase-like isoleucine patch superfamily enzyme